MLVLLENSIDAIPNDIQISWHGLGFVHSGVLRALVSLTKGETFIQERNADESKKRKNDEKC